MGKTEKLVVLSVLFLVVVLFVWSLQGGTPKGDAGAAEIYAAEKERRAEDAEKERREKLRQREGTPRAATPKVEPEPNTREEFGASVADAGDARADEQLAAVAGRETAPPKLLFGEKTSSLTGRATAAADSASATNAPVRMQPGWDLVTTDGLQRTVDPDMFLLRAPADATWRSLARDLYGDESKSNLLRHNNEGLVAPVGQVFVPAKDDLGGEATARIVEVLQGESLWQVATRTLGKGSRWTEIYEANRDVISDPDYVSAGTQLRIPAR